MNQINCFRSTKDGIVRVFKIKNGEIVIPRPNKPIEPMRPSKPEYFISDDAQEVIVTDICEFDAEKEYNLSDFLTKLEQHEQLGNHLHRSNVKFEVEKDYSNDNDCDYYKISIVVKEFFLKKNSDYDAQLADYEEKLKQYELDYKDYLASCEEYNQKTKDFEEQMLEAEITQLNEQIEKLKQKVEELKNEKNI